jgi:hypothetical protein
MNIDEINAHEMTRVLVEVDDIIEILWAKVFQNEGTYLYVTYLECTEKVYKGASVYSFESVVSRVDPESISEHYPGILDMCELGFSKVGANMFVEYAECDSECDSIIEDLACDDDLDDFIVPDEPCIDLPPDADEIDAQWNTWEPHTEGERHYKSVIDRIEERARAMRDDFIFHGI